MSSDTNQIREASAKWVQVFNVNDGSGIAAVYTHDAVLLSPDADPIEMVEDIAGFWDDFSASVNSGDLEVQEVFVGGDLANVVGKYRLEIEGQQPLDGKYIEVWTRGAAGWLMHPDIWKATP